MLPFDPLTAGSLLIMAASSSGICQIPKAAEISVLPSAKKLIIDTSRSGDAIQNTNIDTINPYGYNSTTHTNGFMKGGISMTSSVSLDYKQAPRMSAFCLWYDKVTIKLEVTPEIVIAKEVAQDRCMYKAVLEHEMKHVKVDRRIVNKYAKTIGKKVFDGLQQRGFIAGPIASEDMQEISDRMKKTVGQIVEFEHKKMEIDRAEAQQAVDSLKEYQRVQAKCPDYKSPK